MSGENNSGIYLFLIAAVLVLVLIVVLGVLSTRKKKRSTKPSYQLQLNNGNVRFDRDAVEGDEELEALLTKYSGILGHHM